MRLHLGSFACLLPLVLTGLALLAGCQSAAGSSIPPAGEIPSPGASQTAPTATIPATTASPTAPPPSPTPASTSTPQDMTALCSPLEGETLDDLGQPDLLKNPFLPPPPGDDGGHFGVDFAYWTRPDGTSMVGLPIYSVLDGVVASMIDDRTPYGNALIIETRLDQIDPGWLAQLPIQGYDPGAPLQPAISLTCPAYDFTPDSSSLSLYLLYAHMLLPTQAASGSPVACGQPIGQVGTTGKSVNAHLHLETRIGPSGVRFSSLAHYDTGASSEEMRNYCLWRLSGAFMPFDPMTLLSIR